MSGALAAEGCIAAMLAQLHGYWHIVKLKQHIVSQEREKWCFTPCLRLMGSKIFYYSF